MKWEDLQKQAQKIVNSRPAGEFQDKMFSTRSGPFRTLEGMAIIHIGESDHYTTRANGRTCAKHITVRCRDTRTKDSSNRTIYECENGKLFTFILRPGDAYCFSSARFSEPELKPTVIK